MTIRHTRKKHLLPKAVDVEGGKDRGELEELVREGQPAYPARSLIYWWTPKPPVRWSKYVCHTIICMQSRGPIVVDSRYAVTLWLTVNSQFSGIILILILMICRTIYKSMQGSSYKLCSMCSKFKILKSTFRPVINLIKLFPNIFLYCCVFDTFRLFLQNIFWQ